MAVDETAGAVHVPGLGYHRELAALLEEHLEPAAHHAVIVGEDDPDRVATVALCG